MILYIHCVITLVVDLLWYEIMCRMRKCVFILGMHDNCTRDMFIYVYTYSPIYDLQITLLKYFTNVLNFIKNT